MEQKINYIPTLQEFMKKRRKTEVRNTGCLNSANCMECEYHKGKDICVWGGTIKMVSFLKVCPISHKELV